ncbi:hypothetical protein RhiirB3_450785 [Rhizophagus irregularis]|nr:hypothetical protein RhiirB3_450785 [Rhizophagus irregularis]
MGIYKRDQEERPKEENTSKPMQILKHNEQWSIALEKIRQYVNQFIREGNRRVVKAHTEAI